MNLQLFTFPWGNPGEVRTRPWRPDASPAWRAPPQRHHISGPKRRKNLTGENLSNDWSPLPITPI